MFKLSIKTPKRRQWRLSVNVIWECFAHMEEIETSQLNLHWRSIFMSLYEQNVGFGRSFIKRQTSDTLSDNEWYECQRMTTSDKQQVVRRVTTSGKTRDNEWQEMTTNDNEWKWVVILANFLFFSNRRGTYHYAPKRNSLNTEEDLEERLLK